MSEPLEVPKPVLGAAYEPVLQFKVAVFGQFLKEKAEPTIHVSDHRHASIRCRLRSDSTIHRIGDGKPCDYSMSARRTDPGSKLRLTEINSAHSCSTAARQARHSSDDAVGSLYTRRKLLDLGHKLQDSLAVETSQHEDEPRQELSSTADPKATTRRPVRESAQIERYIFEPSLQPQRAPPATPRTSASSPSKRIAPNALVNSRRARPKLRRRSAPASSVSSTPRSVPPQEPRSSDPTASRHVASNSGALDPAPLPAKPLRTGGVSTVFLQATPKQTSPSSTPSAPPSTTSRSAQSGPVRQFLATTSLPPTQRDVLAGALDSAGVFEAEDLVKVLFLHNDILKDCGKWLGGAESWPADARFRTIGDALKAVVEESRVEAKLVKSP